MRGGLIDFAEETQTDYKNCTISKAKRQLLDMGVTIRRNEEIR